MKRTRLTFRQVEAGAVYLERRRRFRADLKAAIQGFIETDDPDAATYEALDTLCVGMKIDKAILIKNLRWWLEFLDDEPLAQLDPDSVESMAEETL